MRQVGRAESQYSKIHTPGKQLINGRIATIAKVLLKEHGVQTPCQTPQPWAPALGRQDPIASGSENLPGLATGESEGCRKQTPLFKGR